MTMAVVEEAESDDGASGSRETRASHVVVRCVRVVMSRAHEICFVTTVVLALYAVLHSSPLKTQKAQPPSRFFPWNSFVTDFYLGTIHEAFERVSESDVTFIMYYASWDATSMAARWEFSETAKYFHQKVQFLAINCWWPEGECRQHFRRIQSYPVLMAYPGVGRGIQFRGPYEFAHMFRFLENLIRPLRAVFSWEDLLNLRARYPSVLVAYFDFKNSSQPVGFVAYYNTAMKALEIDPSHEICFAVISDKKLASELGLMESKSFILLRFNESVVFKPKNEKLLSWTLSHRRPTVQWLNLPRMKSTMLADILQKSSPTLILFTPQNPFIDSNPYYNLLNQVAMDYFDCNKSSKVQQIIDRSAVLSSLETVQLSQADVECSGDQLKLAKEFRRSSPDRSLSPLMCCYSVVMQLLPHELHLQQKCDVCVIQSHSKTNSCFFLELKRNLKLIDEIIPQITSVNCLEFRTDYDPFSSMIICCKTFSKFASNFSSSIVFDDRISLAVWDHEDFGCVKHRLGRLYKKRTFSSEMPNRLDKNFTGLGCRTNRTLTFVVVDFLQFGVTFIANLGLNLSEIQDETLALIHHTEEEVQYLHKEVFNKRALVEFITNFTANRLNRHLRSSKLEISQHCDDQEICVVELSTTSFVPIVFEHNKDVIIFYYASWCGFCTGIFHIFLQAAHYFNHVPNIVFARINGDKNDLPWEYTASKYPTIIYFPAEKKTESRAFPSEMPITLSNLVRFILANTGLHNRLLLALNLCSTKKCLDNNRKRILSQIQTLLIDVRVNMAGLSRVYGMLKKDERKKRTLLEYRNYLMTELRRKKIQLRHIKRLHLMLLRGRMKSSTRKQIIRWQDEFLTEWKNFK